jgi:hypothetical protein
MRARFTPREDISAFTLSKIVGFVSGTIALNKYHYCEFSRPTWDMLPDDIRAQFTLLDGE